ncbi:hypothetical protein G7054_g4915 [Neopestalotiopsis clavispora]|nr:hypothetical protein G7054_g4915 [Neopestalotiopsis clavispora]
MQATEEAVRQRMALSFDVLWRIGRNHIDDPRDLFALASACRSLWDLLENEVYIADVLLAQAVHSPRIYCDCQIDGVSDDVIDRHSQWCGSVHHILRGPFHAAAQQGDVVRVKRLCDMALTLWPPYIDMKDLEGYSPLLLAVKNGHINVVRFLREAGCYTDANVLVPRQNVGQIAGRPKLDLVFRPVNNDAPLMTHNSLTLAIAAGHEELAKHLICCTEIYDMAVPVPGSLAVLPSAHVLAVLTRMQSIFERLYKLRPFVGGDDYSYRFGPQALSIAATHDGSHSIMEHIVCHLSRRLEQSNVGLTPFGDYLSSHEWKMSLMRSLKAAILTCCPSNALWIFQNWKFEPEFFKSDQRLYVQMSRMLDLCLDADRPQLFVVASQILRCIPDTVAPGWTFTGSDYLRWARTAGVDPVDGKVRDHQSPLIGEWEHIDYRSDFAGYYP